MRPTDSTPDRPNIVLIVLDTCRYDYLHRYGSFFDELREDSLEFTKAIAPAGWSLPSHASIFNGEYPNSHGTNTVYDDLSDLPLISDLKDRGYETYGVSSNRFASSLYGFDLPFDQFYNTHEDIIFLDGISMRKYIHDVRAENDGEFEFSPTHLLRRIIREDESFRSSVNALAGIVSQMTNQFPQLSRIPVRWLQEESAYVHDPHKNASAIDKILSERADDEPFFVFANYMNTHRAYDPPERYQRRFLGEKLSLQELKDADSYVHPFEYAARVGRGETIPDEVVSKLQSLYAGEVCDADDVLRDVFGILETKGIADETIVVVTADHGESLYDEDLFGDRWMAHWNSLSDAVAHVPLLVHGPDVEQLRIEKPISLRKLPDLIRDEFVEGGGRLAEEDLQEYLEPIVFSEFPSSGRAETLREEYPDIPEEHLYRELVAGYAGEWKVVMTTNREQGALRGGEPVALSSAPDELVDSTRARLDLFEDTREEMPTAVKKRLEEIGYL